MKTLQQTLTGDVINRQTREPLVPIMDILWLPIKYFLSTANPQQWLFLLSFLTYGVGDGVTASYMMDTMGAMREINPVVRLIYAYSGAHGVITFKIWTTFLILFSIWIISRRSDSYWATNGLLSALCLGGIMAMRANLMASYGMDTPAPGSIIMIFIAMTFLFITIGDLMDKKLNSISKYSSEE